MLWRRSACLPWTCSPAQPATAQSPHALQRATLPYSYDTPQVQERDAEAAAARTEAAGLRAERHAVESAVEELRTMLMQSVAERTRLAGEAEAQEQRTAALQRVLEYWDLSWAPQYLVQGVCWKRMAGGRAAIAGPATVSIRFGLIQKAAAPQLLGSIIASMTMEAPPGHDCQVVNSQASTDSTPHVGCHGSMRLLTLQSRLTVRPPAQDLDEKAAAVAAVQAQAAELAVKLDAADKAFERSTAVPCSSSCM